MHHECTTFTLLNNRNRDPALRPPPAPSGEAAALAYYINTKKQNQPNGRHYYLGELVSPNE
jgi:hypothetical protein